MRTKIASALRSVTLAVAALAGAQPQASAADFKTNYPVVVKGEFEFENRFFGTSDKDPGKRGQRNFTTEFGYGVTDNWFVEIENEIAKDPGDRYRYNAVAVESIVQLLPQGASVLDLGFFTEFERGLRRDDPDKLIFGPLLQKQFGRLLVTANALVATELGSKATHDPEFQYAAQLKYLLNPRFSPGVEMFGEPGQFGRFERIGRQDHRAGPVIFGQFNLAPGKIKYELGTLFALTPGPARRTLKGLLEYEIFF
jgi:hypothetical protein